MRSPLKALLITASLVAASLGAATSAVAATPAPPTLITTNFACSNGVCEAGPGNVGMPFGAGLDGTGGPACTGTECACTPYIMSVASGSLPPGLQLGRNPCGEWFISGTPTQAGTLPLPRRRVRPHRDQQPRVYGHGIPREAHLLSVTGSIGSGSHRSAVSTAAGRSRSDIRTVLPG